MNEKQFQDRISQIDIDDQPDPSHQRMLKDQVLQAHAEAGAKSPPAGRIPRLWARLKGRGNHHEREVMTKPFGRFAIAAAILAVINIAGWVWLQHSLTARPTPRMRVLTFSPDKTPTEAQRLTLVFDDDVIGPEQVGQTPEKPPFSIEPAPAGSWKWTARNKLEYILAEPLPYGYRYQVSPAMDIEASLGRKLVGPSEFEFQTPPLKLVEHHLDTADGTNATFVLEFNQPVSPADLAKYLEVYVDTDSQALEIQQLTQETAKRHVIRTAQPDGDKLRFSLAGDLTGATGKLSLGETMRYEMHLPNKLTVSYIYRRSERSGFGRVTINFSKSLAAKQPLDQIKVQPAVKDLSISKGNINAIRLHGRFVPGQRYAIHLPATIVSRGGQTLQAARNVNVTLPDRPSGAYFKHKRGVMSPAGNMTLDIQAVNVGSVKLSAYRAYPNNLVYSLLGHSQRLTGRMVLAGKRFDLDLPRNEPADLAADLGKWLGRRPGLYEIKLQRDGRSWNSSSAVVCITDMAITAKKQATGYMVWVTSLSGAKPQPGAKVEIRSKTNQVLGRGTTDADGLADVRCNQHHPAGAPWVIIASKDDDTAFLQPDKNRWMIDHVDTSGRKIPESYDVMLYCERGVYRPGDTVHLTGIIRDAIGKTPDPFPMEIKVIRPDGLAGGTYSVLPEPDAQGVFQLDVPTVSNCRTGVWRFQVTLPGSSDVLGSTYAFVEAFRPVRMAVELEGDTQQVAPGEKLTLNGSGRYLWGKAAADQAAKLTTKWRSQRFESKRWPRFVFDTATTRSIPDTITTTQLDEDGKAHFEVGVPAAVKSGMWQGVSTLSVTQTGGRTVSATSKASFHVSELHMGLALPGRGATVPGSSPFVVRWARATHADQPAGPGKMTLTVYRVEYDYNIVRRPNGRRTWQSVQRLIKYKEIAIDPPEGESTGQIELTCQPGSRYQLSLKDDATASAAQVDFYSTWGDSGDNIALDNPNRAEVVLDRKTYKPGDDATVMVRSPIAGTVLLTLETDRVLEHRLLKIGSSSVTTKLHLPEDLRGGAFIAATIIRELDFDADSWQPHRAMGLARVKLEYPDRTLDLSIESPEVAQPSTMVQVSVDTGKPADPTRPTMVHLWAVDEGICLVTKYRTPDPLGWFLADRRLGVDSSDSYGSLLPDYKRPEGMTRIGAGDNLPDNAVDPLRRNPVPTRRREPDVIWQQVVAVGPDGRAEFDMPMPHLYGQMRLMAVAVDADRYASTEKAITLRSDLMVEASWPRFAAPGDEFRVPVRIINTTNAMIPTRLNLDIIGPLDLVPDRQIGRIEVEAQTTETIWLTCKPIAPGPVEGIVSARQIAETFDPLDMPAEAASTFAMPIRPGNPLHGQTRVVSTRAGREMTLTPSDEIIDGMRRRRLQISANPNLKLLPTIDRLLRYPHGCVEQTTSTIYPLLYAPDLIGQVDPEDHRLDNLGDMVYAGLNRLWSMQTRSGGLAYWPGGSKVTDWGTAYAAGVILEAAQAGYRVDAQFTGPLMKYIHGRLNSSDERININTRALFCRVLAKFGKPAHGWMAKLVEQSDQLDLAGRAHLAAALFEAGRGDQARKLLTGDVISGMVALSHAGRITTPAAQDAIMLSVVLDIQADHPWTVALVSRLANRGSDGHWHTTVSNAQALAALSKFQVIQASKADFTGTINVAGKVTRFTSEKMLSVVIDQPDMPIEIKSEGSGKLFLVSMEEGIAKPGVIKPHDSGLVVRRRWLDGQGKPVDPQDIAVGDLVYVEIDLRRSVGRSIDNIAIVDALAGGFEIESPRLATSATDGLPAANRPDRMELLDDRAVLFSTASRKGRTFRYAIRATTVGTFKVPALQASAMYNPDIASVTEEGQVRIHE